MVESFFVANDLDRDHVSRLVIAALKNLAERAFAEDVDDLVAIVKMIVRDEKVVTPLVIVSVVVCRVLLRRGLLLAVRPNEVDLAVVADLLLFVGREEARVERQSVYERERRQKMLKVTVSMRRELTFRVERWKRVGRVREFEHFANGVFRHASTQLLAVLASDVRCHLLIGPDLVFVYFALTGRG